MPDAIVKALATITEPDTTATDDAPYGGFTAVLSTPTLDRDDDELHRDEWIEPLPKSIPIDIDHQMSVEGTVGSGRPYFDDGGRLMLDARFANTDKAQQVRSLVRDGHIGAVSVAFLNRRSTEKGAVPRRELLNAGIVAVPANPEAVILSAKALNAVEAYAKAAKKDDGPFADPGYLDSEGKPAKDGNGQPRYKIDSEETTRAAWSYINMPKNAKFYTAEQLAKIKDKIKAAAAKFGIKIDDDDQKAFDRVTALTDTGLTFDEICKALDLDADRADFIVDAPSKSEQAFAAAGTWTLLHGADEWRQSGGAVTIPAALSDGKSSARLDYSSAVGDLLALAAVHTKAGARNSASDTKMIQAIHDASSLLGAECVSEAAPDESDGSSEGANKSVHQSMIIGKCLSGSLEDLQNRVCDAVQDVVGDGFYAWVRATFLDEGGTSGTVVYDLGEETYSRRFTVDGTLVTLGTDLQCVTILRTLAPADAQVDDDPSDAVLDAAAAAETRSVGNAPNLEGAVRDIEDFKAKLDALTKTSGDAPGSPESPATTESVSPDSKAASKEDSAADAESADDDDDSAADDDTEDDDDDTAKALRARLMMTNARMALVS